ncbi:plasmid mobilization protein [Mangrovactinospora gilvigrisea]|nr:hypothetical protein [Mangrovactinospora gilvigrisea]
MAETDPQPDTPVEVRFDPAEYAALKAAAEAAGVPVADYVHDASLREQQHRTFNAAADAAWGALREEFDAKFPPSSSRAA